jgi:hypothetical protein
MAQATKTVTVGTVAGVIVASPSVLGTGLGTFAIGGVYGFRANNQGNAKWASAYAFYADAQSGSTNNYAFYGNAGQVVFNAAGAAEADFTAKTDNYNAIFMDTSNDSIVIMSNAAGKVGFFGAAAVAQPSAYTVSNGSVDRTFDANSTTIDELSDIIATLISDLQSVGLVG